MPSLAPDLHHQLAGVLFSNPELGMDKRPVDGIRYEPVACNNILHVYGLTRTDMKAYGTTFT